MTVHEFGDELLTSLLTFTVNSVPGAIGAGLNVAADMTGGSDDCLPGGEGAAGGAPRSVAAVGVAAGLDHAQWARATGPLWEAFRTGQLVTYPALAGPTGSVDRSGSGPLDGPADGPSDGDGGDGHGHGHGLELAHLDGLTPAESESVRGAVFLAGEWGGDLPVVLSIYLDRAPDDKVLREIDRYEPLVTQALALVEYCTGEEKVAQQMLQMTQYRRVIEQAKGLVMGAAGGDANTAFATLARASQHFNIRLRNLAVALVEHVGKGAAEHPDDPELVVRPSQSERDVAARVWAALTTTTAIMPVVSERS